MSHHRLPEEGAGASSRASRAIVLYLALGGLGASAYFLADGAASVGGYLLVSLLAAVALLAGPRLRGAGSARPWFFLALGQAAFFSADLMWYTDPAAAAGAYPTPADLAYLAGYPAMAIGLYQFVGLRRPRHRLAPLVDASAVGIAGALVVWLVLVERFVHDAVIPLDAKVALLAYPLGDVVLLAAAAYVVLSRPSSRGASPMLLVVSLISLLFADMFYTGMLIDVGYDSSWVDGLWLASYVLFGLAALVPSMRDMTEPEPAFRPLNSAWHLLVPALVVGAAFAFGLIEYVLYGHVDLNVIAVTEIMLVVLLLVRLYDLARTALDEQRRHTALLSNASDAYLIFSPAGQVSHTSANPAGAMSFATPISVGTHVREIFANSVHPDDLVSRAKPLTDVLAVPGASATTELRMRMADSSYRWLRISATNRVSERAVGGIVVNYHDVTLHHEVMERLRRQADILRNIRESVTLVDLEGRVRYWNAGATEIFGYEADEMLGQSLALLYDTQDAPGALAAQIAGVVAAGEHVATWHGRRRDGSRVIVDAHLSLMRDEAGVPVGILGVSRDVTESLAAERTMARLAAAVEQASEAVVIADTSGSIEYVNPAFEQITGYSRSEVVGRNPRMLQSGQHPRSFYHAMWQALTSGRPWVADFVNRRADGSLYESSAVISPIRDDDGSPTGYVAVSRDVTAERRTEKRAERLARQRALIAQTLRELDTRASPEDTAAAISRQVVSLTDVCTAGLFIFAPDGYGLPYGFAVAAAPDAQMPRVPKPRTAYLRERAQKGPWIEAWRDMPAHPYNDLFVGLGVKAIAYAPVRDGEEVIGFLHISSASADADDVLSDNLPALLEFADICGAQLGPQVTHRAQRAEAREQVARIIRRRALSTVFQPIVDLERARVVGFEALTRFADGVAPDVMLAQALDVRLDLELDLAMLRSALASAVDLPTDAWLNVNVSPRLVRDRRLARLLAGYPRHLVLEITEHSEITDYRSFRAAVGRLGPDVELAVDDAGAGFASLRHILELRPQVVKLDRALVHGVDTDDARQGLIAGVTHFARSGGFTIVAEGVETAGELAVLHGLGVTLVQGYLLARPAPVGEAAAFSALDLLSAHRVRPARRPTATAGGDLLQAVT